MKKCLYSIKNYLKLIFFFSIFFSNLLNYHCEIQLNDILLFNFDKLRYGSLTLNSNGDMIFECSVEEAKGTRVFYWLKKDGSYYFQNEKGEKIPTKVITVRNNDGTFPIRYESQIISIISSNNNEYLISISLYEGFVEYYDLKNGKVTFVSTIDFTNYDIHSYYGTLIEIKNSSPKKYFHSFIGQHKSNRNQQQFYLITQQYSFSSNRISLNNGYALDWRKISLDLAQRPRIVSTYISDSEIIIAFFLNYNYGTNTNNFIINTYLYYNFEYKSTKQIGQFDDDYNPYQYIGIFYKAIHLKGDLGAFMFYKNNNWYSIPYFQIIEINNYGYNFNTKFQFQLDGFGDLNTEPRLNDMIKISDKRFSFISCSKDRTKLFIIFFDFFNNDNKIKERRFQINIFNLKNYRIYIELSSIVYNNYLANKCL